MTKPNIYLFPQLDDNYGYLIKNPHATEGILVDPSDLEMCLKILELNDCKASHILLTHHHDDHIAAVHDLKNKFQSIIIGYENDENIPHPDLKVKDEEIFELHQNKFKVIHTPGHTLQHINYFMPDCIISFFQVIPYLVLVVVECLREHPKFSGKVYQKLNNFLKIRLFIVVTNIH